MRRVYFPSQAYAKWRQKWDSRWPRSVLYVLLSFIIVDVIFVVVYIILSTLPEAFDSDIIPSVSLSLSDLFLSSKIRSAATTPTISLCADDRGHSRRRPESVADTCFVTVMTDRKNLLSPEQSDKKKNRINLFTARSASRVSIKFFLVFVCFLTINLRKEQL